MKRFTLAIMIVIYTMVATGCGYILYPERQGLKGGQLDAGVVVLDAVGLLLFFVPGVIAFAVDFTNGTIFLPPGEKSFLDLSALTPGEDAVVLKFDAEGGQSAMVEALSVHLGQQISSDQVVAVNESSRMLALAY